MKVCPNCGTQAEDGAFFCPNCQADLPASTVVTYRPEEQPPYDPFAGQGIAPDSAQPAEAPAQAFGQPGEPGQWAPDTQAGFGQGYVPTGQVPAQPGQYAAGDHAYGQPHAAQSAYGPPGMQYQVSVPLDPDGVPLGATKWAWGAFFFGWIWCAVYGLWVFLAIDLGIQAVSAVLNALPSDNTAAQAISGLLGAASLGWRIFLGFIGPKTFWRQYSGKYTVERWNRHQRNWGIAAIVYLVVACACVVAAFAALAAGFGAYMNSIG